MRVVHLLGEPVRRPLGFREPGLSCTALLGLNAAVEVLAPASLRHRVATEARGAAARCPALS